MPSGVGWWVILCHDAPCCWRSQQPGLVHGHLRPRIVYCFRFGNRCTQYTIGRFGDEAYPLCMGGCIVARTLTDRNQVHNVSIVWQRACENGVATVLNRISLPNGSGGAERQIGAYRGARIRSWFCGIASGCGVLEPRPSRAGQW